MTEGVRIFDDWQIRIEAPDLLPNFDPAHAGHDPVRNTASKQQLVMINTSVQDSHALHSLKDELDGGCQLILVEFIAAEAVDDCTACG
jgi:hypothetical protein